MAQDKKSFILHTDLLTTVEKLPDNKAGRLFKMILEYVNDKNPQTEDLLLQVAFEPVKQQLKRNLKNWEEKRHKRSEAGKAGGIKSGESRRSEANVHFASKNEANEAVSVSGSVNVSDSVSVKRIGFAAPSKDDVRVYCKDKGYTQELADKVFDYYDSANWKDSSGKQVKSWKQKLISVWFKDEYKLKNNGVSLKDQVAALKNATPGS